MKEIYRKAKYQVKRIITFFTNSKLLLKKYISAQTINYQLSIINYKTQTINYQRSILNYLLFTLLLLTSCQDDFSRNQKKATYKGPLSEIFNIKMVYSDSAKKMVSMETAVQYQYATEDKFYPKEVRVFFFDKTGKQTTTLRGDSARYFRDRNYYKVMGNVTVINTVKGETLNTDELIWRPDDKKIFTDHDVKVQSKSEVIYAKGMDANQDFSHYTFRKAMGTLNAPQGLE